MEKFVGCGRLQRWGSQLQAKLPTAAACKPMSNRRPKRMKYRVANNLMFMEALAMVVLNVFDFEHTVRLSFLSRHFWLFSNTTSLEGPSRSGKMMFYGVMPWTMDPHVGRVAVAGFLRDDGTAVCKRRHLSSHGMPLTQATVTGRKFSSAQLPLEPGDERIKGTYTVYIKNIIADNIIMKYNEIHKRITATIIIIVMICNDDTIDNFMSVMMIISHS